MRSAEQLTHTCDDNLFVLKIHQKISYFKRFSCRSTDLFYYCYFNVDLLTRHHTKRQRRHKLCPFIKMDRFLSFFCVPLLLTQTELRRMPPKVMRQQNRHETHLIWHTSRDVTELYGSFLNWGSRPNTWLTRVN